MELRVNACVQSSLSPSRYSFWRSQHSTSLFRLHPASGLLNLGFDSVSRTKALVRSEISRSPAKTRDEGPSLVPQTFSITIPVGNRHILVETGHIGRQASGSVSVTDGETIVYTSVCLANTPSEHSDVFPLSVHYQERFSAAGRTSGGYFKREGRTRDHEVLICRLIDRPLRPTLPKGFCYETQILSWVLSYDGLHSPDSLAVTAAGIAMALSEVPNSELVAGVQIGMIGDKFIVNPTVQEMENSDLDMFLAGTVDAVLMVEGCCNFLSEEKFLEAVKIGQDAVRAICNVLEGFVGMRGKKKIHDGIKLPDRDLYTHVEKIAGGDIEKALDMKEKKSRNKALSSLEAKLLDILTVKGYVPGEESSIQLPHGLFDSEKGRMPTNGETDEDEKLPSSSWHTLLYSDVDVKLVFKDVTRDFVRKRIVKEGKRSDGRNVNEIRPINSRCGFLPRAHGSALFTRGETQSLAVVTLGDRKMAQRIDNLIDGNESKRFYLQYTFPPSCVGEIGRIGAPTRREIGHGVLAEKSLEPILPSEDDFPYTIRVESTITESNGSSSMASVCGGCLALQDAGVPLKCSIAGIAMGMIFRTGDEKCLILSDINGLEDACGDMDFKIAGSEDGITAFQMDIKVLGVTLDIMKQALLKAKEGRKLVLTEMLKCSPPPSKQLSRYAPLIHVLKVSPDKINLIIGSGGKRVKNIIEQTGIESIDADDEGQVTVVAKDRSSLEKSKAIIGNLVMVPTVGAVYRDCEIKAIARYGIFVEVGPGWEGLCHVSELSSEWLVRADTVKVGDRIDVRVLEVNEKGHVRLSHRAVHSNLDAQNSIMHDHPQGHVEESPVAEDLVINGLPKLRSKNIDEGCSMRSSSCTSDSVDDDVVAAQRLVRRLVGSPSALQK